MAKQSAQPEPERDPRSIPLGVINDSASYDMVVRPAMPYVMSDGTVIDLTDREKYPLATDHERFKPIPSAKHTYFRNKLDDLLLRHDGSTGQYEVLWPDGTWNQIEPGYECVLHSDVIADGDVAQAIRAFLGDRRAG